MGMRTSFIALVLFKPLSYTLCDDNLLVAKTNRIIERNTSHYHVKLDHRLVNIAPPVLRACPSRCSSGLIRMGENECGITTENFYPGFEDDKRKSLPTPPIFCN
jgi:hypothetical protein